MRSAAIGFIGASMVIALTAWVTALQPQRPSVRILEQAPADRSVAILSDTLSRYLREMDAHKLSTLRMIEGGKYNVNIRRITNAETALAHPNTIDLWVVLEGSGTMTTGGRIEAGTIVDGESNPLNVGDVYFVPAGVPHGVSGVAGNITWLNVRWDVDWPAEAPLGAGTLPQASSQGAPMGRPALKPLQYAPNDRAIHIPKRALTAHLASMEADKRSTLRLIEGGHFNVNIRRITTPSAEHHPLTADTWVLLDGGGIVSTGFGEAGGKPDRETGANSFARVGDLFFVPPAVTHGFSTVDSVAAWLNIRWDTNWAQP